MIADLALGWRLGWRDLRSSLRGFTILIACLTLGVAAVAAVGLVNAAVVDGLRRDARALLGGDIELDNPNQPIPEAELRRVVPGTARLGHNVRTNAMVTSADGRHVPVSLKAVDETYPLVGEVVLDPPGPVQRYVADGGGIAEATLADRLGLKLGDSVQLGDVQVQLRAFIEREPDRVGGYITIGPRLIVSQDTLAKSRILRPGAMARFEYRMALPEGADIANVAATLKRDNPDASYRIRTSSEVQPQIARFTDRLASYLTLAALATLLVGGLGVALSTAAHLGMRVPTIATLKSLGATGRQITLTYLAQILVVTGAGTVLGLLVGMAIPVMVIRAVGGLLPVAVTSTIQPVPLLLAAACGMLTALAFTLWPLGRARETRAAVLFRSVAVPGRQWPRATFIAGAVASLAGLVGLAAIAVFRPQLALVAAAVGAVAAVILSLIARVMLRSLERLTGDRSAAVRLAVGNLTGAGSGAASVLVALGAGLAMLTTMALLQSMLTNELQERVPERAPDYIAIDIQPDQWQPFQDLVRATEGAAIVQSAPTLRARIVRIGGRPVDEVPIAEHVRWTTNRDRGLTYEAAMPEGTELTAGQWWAADYQGPPLVSVEDEVAIGYGLTVGDTIGFNILGRVIEARIANLRQEIDWGSGRLDFVFIMSPGVIDKAPHTVIAAVEMPRSQSASFVDRLATGLPNVTPISVRDIVAQIGEAMAKIGIAVDVVAGVTLLGSILVLAGAVMAAQQRHAYQTVLLKVLGARRREVMHMLLIEYGLIGIGAAVLGVTVGVIGAWAASRFALDLTFAVSIPSIVTVIALALTVTLAVGLIGVWRVLGRPAAALLRAT